MANAGNEFSKRYEALGGKLIPLTLTPCIRINTLKHNSIERLQDKGIALKAVPFLENAYYARSPFSIGATTEHLLGYYYIQSAAAQLPAVVLGAKPGEKILDMCAAPGGKTTQLAALMQNNGELLAFELKQERMKSLITNLERCGVTNCAAFIGDASRSKRFAPFDRVLLDAPCSGNYVTDPNWFKRRTLEGIRRSAQIQRKLLRTASSVLKSGGTLVYSTCSLDPLENELNIQWALDNLPLELDQTGITIGDPGLTHIFGEDLNPQIARCRRFWPHKTRTEGFFIAKLVKA